MTMEAIRPTLSLSQEEFEDIHAHVARMVDSDDYTDSPNVTVNRHIMARSVALVDGSASVGGSPQENIPVVSAAVKAEQGDYQARAYKHAEIFAGQTEVVRNEGEYKAVINNPRAAVLVASLAAKAIDQAITRPLD